VLERTGWPGPGATAPAPPRRAPAGDPPPSRAPAVGSSPLPHRPADGRPPRNAPAGGPPVLWLCGATGTGKSAVGYLLHLRAARAGRASGYVDLDQIGMV